MIEIITQIISQGFIVEIKDDTNAPYQNKIGVVNRVTRINIHKYDEHKLIMQTHLIDTKNLSDFVLTTILVEMFDVIKKEHYV